MPSLVPSLSIRKSRGRVCHCGSLPRCPGCYAGIACSALPIDAPGSAVEVQGLNRLTRVLPQLPVVILSDGEDLHQIRAAIDSGARGYIPTSLKLAVAVEALRLVRAGGVFVPATSVMTAPQYHVGGPRWGEREQAPAFTPRQAAVVEAIAHGKPNKLIARELNMCESTVKVHVRRIMKKLGAKNRTEVALIANGLPNDRLKGAAIPNKRDGWAYCLR